MIFGGVFVVQWGIGLLIDVFAGDGPGTGGELPGGHGGVIVLLYRLIWVFPQCPRR
jgi:hypothetical protein